MEFQIQTGEPLTPASPTRLPDTCVVRITAELQHSPLTVMQWLEETQPHIRWTTQQTPVKGMPRYMKRVGGLFIDMGSMAYTNDSQYRFNEHTHLLTADFQLKEL